MTQHSTDIPTDLVQQADGTWISKSQMEPYKVMASDLAEKLFTQAQERSAELSELKKLSFDEMLAFREMMANDYGRTVGGKLGGFSIRSLDGKIRVEFSVTTNIQFGPQLEVAKVYLDEYLTEALTGSSEPIRTLITDAFKMNAKGGVDTSRILGLRKHKFDHPKWAMAMSTIEDAILADSQSVYVRYYQVDPDTKRETRVDLDIATVALPSKARDADQDKA